MIFRENVLDIDTYNSLRKSVDWITYSEEQTEGFDAEIIVIRKGNNTYGKYEMRIKS